MARSPRLEKVEYDDGRRYRILFNEVLGSGAQAAMAKVADLTLRHLDQKS